MRVVNFKPILFPLIIYLLPFVEFIKNNINEVDIILVKSFFFLIFVTFIFLLIFAYIINFFFKNAKFSKIFFIVTFIYWLFFKHNLLNLTIKPLLDQFIMNETDFSSELSLLILIIISIYASILIYKENIFFKKFIFIFISLSLLISLFQIVSFDHNSNLATSKNTNTINFPDKLNNKKENIYFFILDAMQPINEFKKHYKINNENFLKYVESNDYQYIFNTVNTYNNTTHSLSALFYLDEIFDEEEKLKQDAKVLYPSILRLNNKPVLIKNLDKLGYNFKWIGNLFADCPKFNLNYCLNKDENKIIDIYLYINFFRQTPLIQTIMTFGQVFKFDFDKHFYYKLNNGIGRLTSYLRENYQSKDKPTFYFTHHMSPHWPYINNPDCSYKRYPGNKNYEGYKSAYLCNLKRIKETIKFLNDSDPNATVVFQSDHNWPMSRNIKERKMIFNLLKINKDCHLDTNVSWNNVNTLRLIFSCMTGNKPKYIDN